MMALATRFQLHKLERDWQTATDKERKRIERRIQALKQQGKEDQEEGKVGAKAAPAAEEPKSSEEQPESSEELENSEIPESEEVAYVIPALEDLPHALYSGCVDIMLMIQVEGGWMSYETYRKANPNSNIFNVAPNDVAVMYLNQRRYQEVESGDPHEIITHCARQLPSFIEPIEISLINGLLFMEAQYDPRIEELGYKGDTMYDFEKNGLFEDFYNGIIYNVCCLEMTLEEARVFAETGEINAQPAQEQDKQPEPSKQLEQPKKPTQQPAAQQTQPKQKPTGQQKATQQKQGQQPPKKAQQPKPVQQGNSQQPKKPVLANKVNQAFAMQTL